MADDDGTDDWAPVAQQAMPAAPEDDWAPVSQATSTSQAASDDDDWAPVGDLPEPESALKTVGRKVLHEALPFAASLPAMGAGAAAGAAAGAPLAPLTFGLSVPIGGAIGAGIAGFGANWLASAAEDKLESMLGIDDSAQRQSNAQAHSTADMVGDIIPMAAGFRVGQLAGSLVSRGINAAGMGGVSAAQQLATTGKIDPAETAEQAALGALFNEPRSGTAKLLGAGSRLVPGRPDLKGDQTPKEDAGVPPPPVGQPGVASEPVRPARREVGDETGSANQYPKENATPSDNGPNVSEGDTDPTIMAAVESMAQPRPDQAPVPPRVDTGIEQAAAEQPGAVSRQPEPSANEAPPAAGEIPPSAEDTTDVQHPILPNVQVEHADLPAGYIARSDNAGTKVYLAPGVPDTLNVNGHTVPVVDALKVHEVFERRGIAMLQRAIAEGRHPPMDDAQIYAVAHEKVGTAAERAYLEEHVGTPDKPFTDADFAEYQRQMRDLSRAQKGGDNVPADLYRFMDEHEQALRLHTEEVTPHEEAVSQEGAPSADQIADALKNFGKPGAVTAAVKEAPGLKPVLKLIAEHPTMDPKAKAELSAKLKTAPPEEVAKAYEALRPRQRAAVEGLGVQARDKADAERKQGVVAAVRAGFEKAAPKDDKLPVGRAALAEFAARLQSGVDHATEQNGGNDPLGPKDKGGYKPAVKDAPYQWLRLARKALQGRMTEAKAQEFLSKEKALRSGNEEHIAGERADFRAEADKNLSRRSGDAAIESGVAHRIEPFAEQDAMAARLDAPFDVPHEEGEQGRTPEPVTSREDLVRLGDAAAKPFDLKAMTPAEISALAERMAKEPETAGKPQWKIDEEARAEKTANLRALRLARSGAKPLMPEVEKRARFAWSELNPINHARGARPISRKALDMGASAKIISHLDERYPGPGEWNTHNKSSPQEEYFASIHDGLNQLNQRDVEDKVAIRKLVDAMPKELTQNPALLESIYRAHERGALDSLGPRARELYNTHLKPLFDESNSLAANLRKIAPDKIGLYVQDHIQRIRKGYDPDLDVMRSGMAGDPIQGVQGVSTARRGAMNDRVFSVLERKSDGERFVVSPDADGKGYTKWQGGVGTHVTAERFAHTPDADFSNNGIDYKMRNAYTDEIERNAKFADNTKARYYKNPILSAALSLKDLASQARHIEFLNGLRNDPKFQASTTTNKAVADERGWVATKMPQFDGVYMDPNLARVFDQYAKPGFDTPEWLRSMSQGVTKMLFWMPTAHIANVGAHWFVARGWDWINPVAYKNLAVTGARAIRSVMGQDQYQTSLRNMGAGSRYGDVVSRKFLESIGKAAGEAIEKKPEWAPIAKTLGVGVPELARAVYDGSSRVMWAANDMFLTQAIMEAEQKGMTRQAAMVHAERHIPNYRIPATVIGSGKLSRFVAQIMEDPVYMSFGRYHYGVFNSYAHMVHDMLDKSSTGKQRLDAVGNLMALGLLAYAVKPALDAMARVVTGDKNAEAHPRGPLAVPASVARSLQGKDDIMATLRNVGSMPPLLSTVLEARANKDFSGKDIIKPGDVELAAHGSVRAGGRALLAETDHAARGLVSPYNTAANAYAKGQGPLQAIRDQALDIKEPSRKAVKYDLTQPAKAERAAVNAKPSGPLEALYDKMFGRGR